jgi:hypothetical protein
MRWAETACFCLITKNWATAARVFAGRGRIKDGYRPANKKTIYSLRHMGICMRLEGGVNIFMLAKNAGTSVNQIGRLYARNRLNAVFGSIWR